MAFEREAAIDILAANEAYPLFRNGKTVFMRPRRNRNFDGIKDRVIQELELNSETRCNEVREIVKARLAQTRKNKPIRKWAKNERPREMLAAKGAQALGTSKLLANPPFTGSIDKEDISDSFKAQTTKTELLFLELFYNLLATGGRGR